jgi:Deacetylase PdaC/Protein of unknown function (DUF3298)
MKPFSMFIPFVFVFSFSYAQTTLFEDTAFQQFYYLGTVGDEPVQVNLNIQTKHVTGSYFYNLIGTPINLRGQQTGEETDTGLPFMLEELDENGETVATFTGELSSTAAETGNTFTGTWQGNNDVTLPFKLERVAEFANLTFKQNLIEAGLSYPVFTSKLPRFNTAFNQDEHITGIIKDFQQGQEEQQAGNFFFAWTIHANFEIHYASERLVSLLEIIDSYTGGAHGNFGFAGHTFLQSDGNVQKLELADLFTANTDLSPIFSYVTAELTKQNASFVVSGDVTINEKALNVFTMSPKGLTFHFAPYAVASYAEGPLEVTVPFELIKNSLRPELSTEFSVQ